MIACASSRPRPAPSATRTAISCRRLAARASCRLARLAQTISITTPTAASSKIIAVRRWPATCTASDVTSGRSVFRSGCAAVRDLPRTRSSAFAASIVASGFRRPTTPSVLPQLLVLSLSGNGGKTSTVRPGANNEPKSKEAGSTPTIVDGRPLRMIARPTTPRSRP